MTRESTTSINEYGDPVSVPQTFTVEGFHDAYDQKYRIQAGIPETDSRITLILGNCQVDPIKDDLITLKGYGPFKVRFVKVDPAKASSDLQVFEVF